MREARTVYRFTHSSAADDPRLREDFRSDREMGKTGFEREELYPELLDGMSVFGSLEKAQRRWAQIARRPRSRGEPVRVGEFIARVDLRPEEGHDLEDLGRPDEHLTLWGIADALAASVTDVYPAETPE